MSSKSKFAGLLGRYSAHIPHFKPLAWGVFLVLSALGLLHNYLYYAKFNVAYLEYAELGDLVFAFVDSVTVIIDHAWTIAISIVALRVYFYLTLGYFAPKAMLVLFRIFERTLQIRLPMRPDHQPALEEHILVKKLLDEAEDAWRSASNARTRMEIFELLFTGMDKINTPRNPAQPSRMPRFVRTLSLAMVFLMNQAFRIPIYLAIGFLMIMLALSGPIKAASVKAGCTPVVTVVRADGSAVVSHVTESNELQYIGVVGEYLVAGAANSNDLQTYVLPHANYIVKMVRSVGQDELDCARQTKFMLETFKQWAEQSLNDLWEQSSPQ